MRLPVPALCLPAVLALGCGAAPVRTSAPDESADLEVRDRPSASRMPQGLDGTRWRWVEAHCTEGPLDLSERGYAARLRVSEQEGALTLVTDQVFAAESCEHTLVTRAVLPQQGADWQIDEVVRVAVPSSEACFGRPDDPRPGEVRVRNGRLELLVQRSGWCNGLEVRMVYERASDALPSEDEIVRLYAAQFTRGDAAAVAALFAESGSLLEPFTRTATGDPYRHDGRAAVQRWYGETFATAPWRALRVVELQSSQTPSGAAQRVLRWEYMDPRLEQPLSGLTRFTIAAGEIFEAAIELTSEPAERSGP